jgi:hypothetical protein
LDEPKEQSPLERACARLAAHGVEFIVLGGSADGSADGAGATSEVDFCHLLLRLEAMKRLREQEGSR